MSFELLVASLFHWKHRRTTFFAVFMPMCDISALCPVFGHGVSCFVTGYLQKRVGSGKKPIGRHQQFIGTRQQFIGRRGHAVFSRQQLVGSRQRSIGWHSQPVGWHSQRRFAPPDGAWMAPEGVPGVSDGAEAVVDGGAAVPAGGVVSSVEVTGGRGNASARADGGGAAVNLGDGEPACWSWSRFKTGIPERH